MLMDEEEYEDMDNGFGEAPAAPDADGFPYVETDGDDEGFGAGVEDADGTELGLEGGDDPFEGVEPDEPGEDIYGEPGQMDDDFGSEEPGADGDDEYSSLDQEDIEDSMENGGEDASDEEVESFAASDTEEKVSYDAASSKKPGKLNKKIILNTIVVVAASIFVVTLFMPDSFKQKKNKRAKENGQASDVTLSDFRSMATKTDKGAKRGARAKAKKPPVLGEDGHWYDEDGNIVDDLVEQGYYDEVFAEYEKAVAEAAEEEKKEEEKKRKEEEKKEQREVAATGGGGYATEERPDTRGDALQVSMSGIKGLSGNRTNYATDYEETRLRNALASQAGTVQYQLPDKNELSNNLIAAVKSQASTSSYKEQNDQAGKQAFHTNGQERAGEGEWRARNSLWEGSIFEAELTTALNTDIPGEITARVTKNVYSSQTGEYLLIPQNSILFGTYNSSISYSQSRVQVAWNKIIRPDGYAINLGNFNAVDKHGAAGVKGFVNDHPIGYLKAVAVMSVFNIVSGEFEKSINSANNTYAQNVLANSQEMANKLGEKLIDRALDVQPTLTKSVGTIVYVLTNQQLTMPPVEMPPVTVPYQRKWSWQ